MENTNIQLAANIQKFRKKSGLTQDELAKELGVTFQAISKWENAKSAPDILLLPQMADIFGCHIDELFSREVNTTVNYNLCAELPWHDDEVIRVFQTQGKKILKVEDTRTEDKCTWRLTRDLDSSKNSCEPGKQAASSGLPSDVTLAIKVGVSPFEPDVTHREM